MEHRELEVMWNYYYGMSKASMIWKEELEELHYKKMIKRIYEIIDDEFNEVWYLIRDKKEKSYILKSKCRNEYSKDFMQQYKPIYKISSEVIKMFDKGIYPIIFKIPADIYSNFYNEEKNVNYSFFKNYYSCIQNNYKAVREYRNKVEFEVFTKEEDAIYWCSDFSITKDFILKSNTRPLNLIEMVCEYKI